MIKEYHFQNYFRALEKLFWLLLRNRLHHKIIAGLCGAHCAAPPILHSIENRVAELPPENQISFSSLSIGSILNGALEPFFQWNGKNERERSEACSIRSQSKQDERSMKNSWQCEEWSKKYCHLTTCFFLILFLSFSFAPKISAAEKTWNADETETDWFDDANWFPQEAPTAADDVTINKDASQVEIGQSYYVKSLTVGGTQNSNLTIDNFVSGAVTPESETDVAVLNRSKGVIKIKGSGGKTKLKGTYKDSEESLADQPSFIFYVK